MIAGTAVQSYSEDSLEAGRAMIMQGEVTAMDWVGSVLMVDEIEFSIPSDVKVVKGTDEVSFSDVELGDNVTVTYVREKDGSLRAVRIAVIYTGDFPF